MLGVFLWGNRGDNGLESIFFQVESFGWSIIS